MTLVTAQNNAHTGNMQLTKGVMLVVSGFAGTVQSANSICLQ